MTRLISKPGPLPSSCITCRRRRKKCDLSRPCCERCLNGGHKCLGYEDRRPWAEDHQERPSSPAPTQFRPVHLVDSTNTARSKIPESIAIVLPEGQRDAIEPNADYDPRPSILGSARSYAMRVSTSSATAHSASTDSSENFDRSWPQDPHQQIRSLRSRTVQLSRSSQSIGNSANSGFTGHGFDKVIKALTQSIPLSVDASRMIREDYVGHIVSQYYSRRVNCWFMTSSPPPHTTLLSQFTGSTKTTRIMYLEANLLCTLKQNSYDPAVQGYIDWIDKNSQECSTSSSRSSSLSNIADRLLIDIGLAYLKFAVAGGCPGYALLQAAVPKFLRLVAADPNLYTEHPNGSLVVSFPHTLGAPRHELRRFLIFDSMASLIFGVLPLVEYGYDGECDAESHGIEWVHGIPTPLVQVISKVNSRRAGSRVPLDDWQTLERRALAWEAPSLGLDQSSDALSARMARFAVQESWRHVSFIYIYMGLCGASSQYSRVQTSVYRIVQLIGTVTDLPIGMHMFAHCVVAGLAARLETHRVLIYEMLLSFKDIRAWLFRGPEFAEVLYHLWHGVGAGGAAVTWENYVESRCKVIPIGQNSSS